MRDKSERRRAPRQERRAYPRWRGACDAVLEAHTEPPCMVKGQLLDISMTGLAVSALSPLPKDTPVDVRLESEDGQFANEIIGRGVVLESSPSNGRGRCHVIRIFLTDVPSGCVEAIDLRMRLMASESASMSQPSTPRRIRRNTASARPEPVPPATSAPEPPKAESPVAPASAPGKPASAEPTSREPQRKPSASGSGSDWTWM